MNDEILYQIALTLIPGIGSVHAKILLQHLEVSDLFKAKQSQLEKIEGIGSIRARSIKTFRDFFKAENEILFIEKNKIKPLFISNPLYPQRLLNCYDSPTLLYYKGNANLNAGKIIAVIGTRNHSLYGKQLTEKLINDLKDEGILIISGLAFGIDAIAHRTSLQQKIPTIGVLAHGLDQVYPFEHTALATEMTKHGGLLTEFRSCTLPDRHHFPNRNRIVAGMSDATVVIETGIKGGSMITAELANDYNKDVFAFPGRTTDPKSSGCNHLIKNNKAVLVSDAAGIIEIMNWSEKKTPGRLNKNTVTSQRELFIQLTENERIITGILEGKEYVDIDEIYLKSGLSSSSVAAAILSLELHNIISSLPGKLYRLNR